MTRNRIAILMLLLCAMLPLGLMAQPHAGHQRPGGSAPELGDNVSVVLTGSADSILLRVTVLDVETQLTFLMQGLSVDFQESGNGSAGENPAARTGALTEPAGEKPAARTGRRRCCTVA